MPLPTPADVHQNSLLTNISVAFVQNPNAFVAQKVFPTVPVAKQSNTIATYSQADFQRDEMEKRAPGTQSAGGGYRTGTAEYKCDVWAFHVDVDDQTRANADAPFRPDQDAAELLAQKLLIRQEADWATNFFGASIWSSDLTAGSTYSGQWSDPSSTPIQDVKTQIVARGSATGYKPNKLVLNLEGWNALETHPDLLARISGGSTNSAPAMVTKELVAQAMGLDEILVSEAVVNSAQEGLAASVDLIFGNHAVLLYAPPSPSLMTPTAGYTFNWTGMGGNNAGLSVSSFRMEELKSDRHEIEAAWDQVVMSSALGVRFASVA